MTLFRKSSLKKRGHYSRRMFMRRVSQRRIVDLHDIITEDRRNDNTIQDRRKHERRWDG